MLRSAHRTRPATPPSPSPPVVTVVMAVYNAMPYLTEALESLERQTIGAHRMEIIAVDDGSTDGSGAELDRWADRFPPLRVIHQENSGSPSGPRNRAIDEARGRYVFIADADDLLGDEALERMVGMAEENSSDVVLGRMAGLGGREVSVLAFKHAARADLYTSNVYRSLNPQKLFRRSLLNDHGIRFPVDLWLGEDQMFCTEAMLAAHVISVVGDYDCYYARRREDGQHLTLRDRSAWQSVEPVKRVMDLIAERVTDTDNRRQLLARHFRQIMGKVLLPVAASEKFAGAFRDDTYRYVREVCDTYWEPEMIPHLPALTWLRLYCFLEGRYTQLEVLARFEEHSQDPEIVENGRVFRPYPFFRDPAAGLPDELFEMTDRLKARHAVTGARWDGDTLTVSGHARIDGLSTRDVATRLLLRSRDGARTHELPTRHTPTPELSREHGKDGRYDLGLAGWEATLDPDTAAGGRPLAPGVWDLWARVDIQGIRREIRLTAPAATDDGGWPIPGGRIRAAGGDSVVPYRTKGGKFALDIGGGLRPLTAQGMATGQRWDGEALRVTGAGWIDSVPREEVTAQLVLRCRQSRLQVTVPTRPVDIPREALDALPAHGVPADLGFTADIDPLTADHGSPLPPGVWDLHLRLTAPGVTREVRLRAAGAPATGELWRVRPLTGPDGRPRLITPYLTRTGYLALDSGGIYFTPENQLLLAGAGRAPDNRRELVVSGRVGVYGTPPGDLRLRLTVGDDAPRLLPVPLAAPRPADPLPAVPGPERDVAEWPAFSVRVPVPGGAFRRPAITVRLELPVGEELYASRPLTVN
ncbi:glycosyltransferase family 2 protein [Streptomyces carpaticus]|uniref:glycosyltransferase family A protein n=1 Tax=Streptomyces carpaticus TaxID=285558 RepID=UPI0021FF0E8A|nr:glycosyltransferase family 2 protein [Streptomyces carpaticus]